jgi:exopolyphosphatase / guanosine-5'-triphosphate,3'-diphosphate pyrophosphatase
MVNLPATPWGSERVAALDFGSNTVGYLVGELTPKGLAIVARASRFVRLAEGFDRSPEFGPATLTRLGNWCREMSDVLREHRVRQVRAVGTEAVRRATNRALFDEVVRSELGVEVEVIRGEEEARLTYLGVRLGYPTGRLSVIDIGGGSTEIVSGPEEPVDPEGVSLPLGAVTLTERHGEDFEALCAEVRHELSQFRFEQPAAAELTTLGGTGANLAGLDLGDFDPSSAALEGHRIARDRVAELRRRMAARTPQERTLEFRLPEGRADVVIAGLAILECVLERRRIPAVRISRFALRHGLLAEMYEKLRSSRAVLDPTPR